MADAYRILRQAWDKGERDRELGLHLLFLSWYGLVEPPFLTGFPPSRENSQDLQHAFSEVYQQFSPRYGDDPEFLYAVGLMVHLFPWALDESAAWEQISEEYRRKYRQLAPQGFNPALFENRGAYGAYFGRQSAVKEGY